MHKYSAQTKKEPMSADDAKLMANAAEVQATVAAELTAQAQTPEAVNEALKDIAARKSATAEAAGGDAKKSWQERLAATQQKQPAATNDFGEKLARIRKAEEDLAAEEAKRKVAPRGPSAGPEQGRPDPPLGTHLNICALTGRTRPCPRFSELSESGSG